jgi:hypothetical protein
MANTNKVSSVLIGLVVIVIVGVVVWAIVRRKEKYVDADAYEGLVGTIGNAARVMVGGTCASLGPITTFGKIGKGDNGKMYVTYDATMYDITIPAESVTNEVTDKEVYMEYDTPGEPPYRHAPLQLANLKSGDNVKVVFFPPCDKRTHFELYRIFIKGPRPGPQPGPQPGPKPGPARRFSCTEIMPQRNGRTILDCQQMPPIRPLMSA